MPVNKNPVERQFTWVSASYLTVFYYTPSLTPQEFLPSLPTHHFSGTVLGFYYTDYCSGHYTCIVQRRCSVLHMSLAHDVIVFCLYHSCQQTNSQLDLVLEVECIADLSALYEYLWRTGFSLVNYCSLPRV